MVHVCLDSNVMSILPLVISVSNKKLKMISQDGQLFKKEDKEVIFVGMKTDTLQYVLLAEKRQKSDVYNNRKYDDFKKWFSTAF